MTRVILYRHFDTKADLYQAVLDRMCARPEAHVDEPVGGFTDDSVDALLAATSESPARFRLLFQHALREVECKERIEKFGADIAEAAYFQIRQVVPDQTMAPWAVQLAPAVAIEANDRLARCRTGPSGACRGPDPQSRPGGRRGSRRD